MSLLIAATYCERHQKIRQIHVRKGYVDMFPDLLICVKETEEGQARTSARGYRQGVDGNSVERLGKATFLSSFTYCPQPPKKYNINI